MLALRLTRFDHIVDLNRVDELRGVERSNGTLTVRSMTRQADVEHDTAAGEAVPLLAQAIPLIGHFQIRNRGTVGGSIAHADPASELPAVALALDAELEVVGPNGTRRVPAAEFFLGTWTTTVEADEILTAVHFPVWPGRAGFAVEEVARRSGDFALTGVVAAVELNDSGRGRAFGHLLPRDGAHSGAGPRRGGRRSTEPRPARPTSRRSHGSRSPTPIRRPTCTRPPSTASTSVRTSWSAPSTEPWEQHAVAEHAISFTVNGRAALRPRRRAQDVGRLPPRGLRAHRHAPRVASTACAARARSWSTARPSARASCSRCRPRAPTSPPSKASVPPTAASARCRRRSARPTGCSAGSAPRDSSSACTRSWKQNPHPSLDEIREGLSGNLCRCTGYQGIIKAVQIAAESMSVPRRHEHRARHPDGAMEIYEATPDGEPARRGHRRCRKRSV